MFWLIHTDVMKVRDIASGLDCSGGFSLQEVEPESVFQLQGITLLSFPWKSIPGYWNRLQVFYYGPHGIRW